MKETVRSKRKRRSKGKSRARGRARTCRAHEGHWLPREEGVEHATSPTRYYELDDTDMTVRYYIRQTPKRYCRGCSSITTNRIRDEE